MIGSVAKLIVPLRAAAGRFARDRGGAVAIYVAVTGALFVGGGVLAIDVGRMVTAMAELQKAADSAALSGAVQLNGTVGACARATQLVQSKIKQASKLLNGASDLLPGTTITFYEYYVVGDPAQQDPATDAGDDCDSEAAWIKVDINPHQLDFMLMPVLKLLTGGAGSNFTNMSAYAVAEYAPLSCETAPLMQCINPTDASSPTLQSDPSDPRGLYTINSGRQYRIKQGPGGPYASAPGNFGMLDIGSGAAAFRQGFNDPSSNNLCDQSVVKPQPGAATGPSIDGLNGRFNQTVPGGSPNPAPNIMPYNGDATLNPINGDTNNGEIGNGNWDPGTYFTTNHVVMPAEFTLYFGVALGLSTSATGSYLYDPDGAGPAPSIHLPTRYQTYLWELGEPFYAKYGMTQYPGSTDLDSHWTQITPLTTQVVDNSGNVSYGSSSVPAAGKVSPISRFNGFTNYCRTLDRGPCLVRHRTVMVIAVNCAQLGLHGSSTPITGSQEFIRYFLVRPGVTGANGYIIGELAGHEGINGTGTGIASDAILGNVRLIE